MLLTRLTRKELIETKKTRGSCDYITAVHRVKIFLCATPCGPVRVRFLCFLIIQFCGRADLSHLRTTSSRVWKVMSSSSGLLEKQPRSGEMFDSSQARPFCSLPT